MRLYRSYLYLFGLICICALALWVNQANACDAEYKRSEFRHWSDIDGDGLDARQQAIAAQAVRDLIIVHGKVVSAIVHDPYTGRNANFPDEQLDVDHIIPLRAAWDRGACDWDAELRKQFANDPENLVAVLPGANRQKGADGPYDWLPPNLAYCSTYLTTMKYLVGKYPLMPTADDVAAYRFLAGKCATWRKGIRLNLVRNWFQRSFGWAYE